eukprot:Tbor_TRINITY_DN6230_c2_g2::TRINITY_DN6230_c2_g2_i15::g.1734::m.1734
MVQHDTKLVQNRKKEEEIVMELLTRKYRNIMKKNLENRASKRKERNVVAEAIMKRSETGLGENVENKTQHNNKIITTKEIKQSQHPLWKIEEGDYQGHEWYRIPS